MLHHQSALKSSVSDYGVLNPGDTPILFMQADLYLILQNPAIIDPCFSGLGDRLVLSNVTKEIPINSTNEMQCRARVKQQSSLIDTIGAEACAAQRSDSLVQRINWHFPNF